MPLSEEAAQFEVGVRVLDTSEMQRPRRAAGIRAIALRRVIASGRAGWDWAERSVR